MCLPGTWKCRLVSCDCVTFHIDSRLLMIIALLTAPHATSMLKCIYRPATRIQGKWFQMFAKLTRLLSPSSICGIALLFLIKPPARAAVWQTQTGENDSKSNSIIRCTVKCDFPFLIGFLNLSGCLLMANARKIFRLRLIRFVIEGRTECVNIWVESMQNQEKKKKASDSHSEREQSRAASRWNVKVNAFAILCMKIFHFMIGCCICNCGGGREREERRSNAKSKFTNFERIWGEILIKKLCSALPLCRDCCWRAHNGIKICVVSWMEAKREREREEALSTHLWGAKMIYI